MSRLSCAILLSAALLVLPSQADSFAPGLLAVGSTGKMCYQAPCPWRGIAEAGARNEPIWWGDVLPEMMAGEVDRQTIVRAWARFDCVLVQGSFDNSVLTVDTVLGACS